MTHQLSSTMYKVLDTLNDCELHTGSEIANSLGISRTAVWKIIQRLKKYNINIQTQHQGYRITAPLILFQKKKIEGLLKNQKIFLELFETLPSTSDYLKSKKTLTSRNVCLAEYQSKGKGRLGRGWISPFGRNIYCSFTYIFNKDISEMSGLSLAVGILTAKALESLGLGLKPLLKWPNDIYVNNQKAGGILIELMAEANGNCVAIISVGLNVNMKDEQISIDQPWTSLEHALNEKLDRNRIAGHLISTILNGMDTFTKEGMRAFVAQWKPYDYLQKKKVSLNMGKQTITGIAQGIDAKGHLLLKLPKGNIEQYSYGDTSILKA